MEEINFDIKYKKYQLKYQKLKNQIGSAGPAPVVLPISFIGDKNFIEITITELDLSNNKIKFDRFYGLGEQDLNQEAYLEIKDDKYKFNYRRDGLKWVDKFEFKNNFSEGKISGFDTTDAFYGASILKPYDTSSNFRLMSWNIYYKIYRNKDQQKIADIEKYLKDSSRVPDILFTQESIIDLSAVFGKPNYKTEAFNNGKSAISINYNTEKFLPLTTPNLLYLNNNCQLVRPADAIRPMMSIRLQNIKTGEIIVFLNLHAPHTKSDNRTQFNNMKDNFESYIERCIMALYVPGDRIIVAGDFNEYYKQFRKDIIIIQGIYLYLKQKNNTCCGSTEMQYPTLIYKPVTQVFDLLYDSIPFDGGEVRVGSSRTSDHHPIIGEFNKQAAVAAGPKVINVGYDFDGVLHRTMSKYERRGPGLYQGHPEFTIPVDKYKSNRNIIEDMKSHIFNGDKVFIVTRNPRDKMKFLKMKSTTLYQYFSRNPNQVIVVPRGISKADIINIENITKFVEDSTSELNDVYLKTRNVDLYLVDTYRSFNKNPGKEPIMLQYRVV